MSPTDPLATFPAHIRDAHARWLATRDLAALDTVVLAIIAFHRYQSSRLTATDDLTDSARLVEDLGYDSLALAEVVFFVEDLFQVAISNEHLRTIHTVADLRAYVREQVAA